jgi:hypothetical protein
MTLWDMYKEFVNSYEYAQYSTQTQRQYGYLLANSFDKHFEGVAMGNISVDDVDTAMAGRMFTHVSKSGVTAAKQFRTAFNAMYKYTGIESPMKGATFEAAGKRESLESQLKDLLTVAYSQFKWRNAGLLMQLTYEQGQPINRLALCTWDNVDLDAGILEVDGVITKLSDDMREMLAQQKEDFGFQQYIAPNPHPTREGYPAYGGSQLSRTIRKIKQAGHIKGDINVSEIRRLGLSRMLADGMDEEEVKGLMYESEHSTHKSFSKTFDSLRSDV